MTEIRLKTGQAATLKDGIVTMAGPAAQHHYRLTVGRPDDKPCVATAPTMPQLLDLATQFGRLGYDLLSLERVAGKAGI